MKKIFIIAFVFISIVVLSGCSSPIGQTTNKVAVSNYTFIRSDDGNETWNPKMKIDDKSTISGIDVLSMAINPADSNMVYIGTEKNGLYVTKDGGETWTRVPFPQKAYGLVFDPNNPSIMYASGLQNSKGKIFKRLAEDQEWKEVYTEPAEGTVISALAIDSRNSNVLYAGTSKGVIVKTEDGGQTWLNLKSPKSSNAPVVSIGFDASNNSHLFFGIYKRGVLETKDGGKNIEDITKTLNSTSVYSLVADPYLGGVVYVGTSNGLFRRSPDGSWNSLNIIESSRKFPIRIIAVNPKKSQEIIYSSARAIYKTTDNGSTWSMFQLDTSKTVGVLRYDFNNPQRIYAGMRKY